MQSINNIKNELRNAAKTFRKSLKSAEKAQKDDKIFKKIILLDEFVKADTVLCYFSSEIEVETKEIINYSLKNGKKVALPKCIDKQGNMVFKYISSLDELVDGAYGLAEPPIHNKTFNDAKSAICIIPCLMADMKGYRLGFGKGYYDRFLSNFNGFKCVICYRENLVNKLPIYEGLDIKCDVFITD